MRSSRATAQEAFSSSAARFYSTSDFQMPAYTSHTSRASPSKTRNTKQSVRSRSPTDTSRNGPPDPGSESDQNLLAMLTSTVACLKEKHMDMEALGCLEQSLWLKRRMFGLDSSAVNSALHEVVLSYNSLAMQFLALGQFDQCLSMLRKADAITSPPGNFKNCQSLQILTYNNIGCCYRKLGQLKSALKYLKEAAQIGAACAHVKNLSITHLNLCAIQSQLGRHDLALEHAQAAIFHTQEELVSLDSASDDVNSSERTTMNGDVLDAKSREEKIVSLAVAYHNLAVELEFNGRGEASLQWYKKALQLVARFKESNYALWESFEKIFVDAKRKYQATQQAPAARPKSAHPSSSARGGRGGGGRGGGRGGGGTGAKATTAPAIDSTHRDVSYSGTVASHCYKPTKPSAAGLQYTRTSPGKSAMRPVPAAPSQRPPSATSSRRRPLSASSSSTSMRQPAAGRSRPMDKQGKDDKGDSIERRWKQFEQEVFRSNEAATRETENARGRQAVSHRGGRPHSAHHVQSRGPQSRNLDASRFRETGREDQQDLMDEDDAYGIVQDDSDEDDIDAQFHTVGKSPAPTNGGQRLSSSTHHSALGSSRSMDPRQQPASARHRQALHESRCAVVGRLDTQLEGDSEGNASIGYAGEEEENECMSETSCASDVPQHRVSHVEYLRRMKKLSDSIHDDLSGKQREPSRISEPAMPARPTSSRDPADRDSNAQARRASTSETEEPVVLSTPRSAPSKVRERLELVRRDSVKSIGRMDDGEELDTEPLASSGTIILEELHVVATENDLRRAENELLAHACARRIQSAVRGCAAARRVEKLRREKVKQRAKAMRAKQKTIEARELELQAKRQAHAQRNEADAARLIQSSFRRYLYAYEEGGGIDYGNESLTSRVVEQEGKSPDMQVPVEAAQDEEKEEPHYTPLPSSRWSGPHRATEAVTSSSLLNTPRSSVGDDEELSPSASSPTSPRAGSSFPPTPRNSVAVFASRLSPHASIDGHYDAAVRIQCVFRNHRAAQDIATRRARRLSRSYIERHHMSLVLTQAVRPVYLPLSACRSSRRLFTLAFLSFFPLHQEAKELSFLEELSAIKIQSLARGRQARFLYGAMVIGRHTAASIIQTIFRRHHRTVERAAARGVESLAARSIQRKYRAFATREATKRQLERDHEAVEVHHIAAQTLQRRWRKWCEQRDRNVEEWEAATCIQALGRGHLTRKSYQSLKESASRSSAFAMDVHGSSRPASRLFMNEEERPNEDEAYEEVFDEDEQEKPASPVVAPGHTTNLSFLPPGVRELVQRYASSPPPPAGMAPTVSVAAVEEMLHAGYGLEEMALELETCLDVASGVLLLDTMYALVKIHLDQFLTLPNLIRVAHAFERRIHDTAFWTTQVETRAAAFVGLYQELLLD
jgi:tetratricopeptide (TPR) repeat protein